ncbi:hypothetical protein GCM10010919_01540 [Alishewanella longhuensis]|uniref:RDD family protein n=1 Tax=Alishewanella longhuensis TaxID=1091037 RepID=A0ABQ3KVF2_9ALTE|nr:hypothetical protein [Alishewanella longhuensis]GHG59201.1 hypothetical protein GCM10010919_01540 [Alishewanella longhuensis]
MADNFDFAALTKSWQQQTTPNEQVPSAEDLTRASQRQQQQRFIMYGELLGALVMIIAAYLFLQDMQGWLRYLTASFLLIGAISTLYVSWQVHKPIVAYDNWSSNGLLQFRLRSCKLSLKYYRYNQFSFAALILFSALLWLGNWWQAGSIATNLLLIYALVISPLSVLGIYWLQRKVQQKTTELQHLSKLVADFRQNE